MLTQLFFKLSFLDFHDPALCLLLLLALLSSSSSWPFNMEFSRDHPCTSISMTFSLAISCLYFILQTKPTSVSLACTSLVSILLAGLFDLKLSISKAEVMFYTSMTFFANSSQHQFLLISVFFTTSQFSSK